MLASCWLIEKLARQARSYSASPRTHLRISPEDIGNGYKQERWRTIYPAPYNTPSGHQKTCRSELVVVQFFWTIA